MTKILLITISVSLISFLFCCGNEKNSEEIITIKKDSLQTKRAFDSLLAIIDFIDNSGGRLTTKETEAIYYADTNLVGNLVNLGATLIEEGYINGGLSCLNRALAKDKHYASLVYFYKGIGWHNLKNKDSAYYYLDKSISLDSSNVKFLYYRSVAYYDDSLYQHAINDISIALNYQPKNLSLKFIRGVYKMEALDFNGAAIDMKDVPLSMKKDYRAYRNRAIVALKIEAFEECIKQCDICISLKPNDWECYRYRGSAKSKLQDFKGAFDDLKKAVDLGDKESVPTLKEYEEFFRTHKQI